MMNVCDSIVEVIYRLNKGIGCKQWKSNSERENGKKKKLN